MPTDPTMSSTQETSAESPSVSTPANVQSSLTPSNHPEEMAAMTMTRISPDLSLKTSGFTSTSSPPHSPSSPASRNRSRSPLSIDLSNVPSLASPAPPSNTLIITRLEDPKIFHPASLTTIREHLSSIAPLNSFSPLKSMSRIIVSFNDEADAMRVRQEIDRTAFTPSSICKCYFGEPTPVGDTMKFLDRPDAGRLFFISPPPSPPVGWESRHEDPPNKQVHAEDLATKLSNLTGKMELDHADQEATKNGTDTTSPGRRAWGSMASVASDLESPTQTRSRSSTMIFDPKEHPQSPGLPAVLLETEDDAEVELADTRKTPLAHTMRPPTELMHE